MRIVYVYTLTEPNGDVRYVGITVDPKRRMRQHLYEARKGNVRTHKNNWIRSLLSKGEEPTMRVVEESTEDRWHEAEARWIKHYANLGCRLVNSTSGGEGVPNPPEATKQKIRLANLGRKVTAETRAKMRAAKLGKKQSSETVARRAAALRGNDNSASLRAKWANYRRALEEKKPIVEEMYRSGLSIQRIAKELRMAKTTVRSILIERGVPLLSKYEAQARAFAIRRSAQSQSPEAVSVSPLPDDAAPTQYNPECHVG